MVDLVLATRNKDKISEILQVLGNLNVCIHTFIDMRDLPLVEEDGRSLYENALKKAIAISLFTNKLTLADDTGLEVDFLGNRPGILSARFSGKDATYEENNKKLLGLLSGVPQVKRKAHFICEMVLAFPNGKTEHFRGILDGEITTSPKGKNGFGYDPVFFVPEFQKTLAEMSKKEKNNISHRGKALKKVYNFLKNYINVQKGGKYEFTQP